jgi:hypothetical protein
LQSLDLHAVEAEQTFEPLRHLWSGLEQPGEILLLVQLIGIVGNTVFDQAVLFLNCTSV